MSDAPEQIWAGPDEDKGWGVLHRGEDVFWEDEANSTPEDRSGLSEYVRADIVNARVAEKVREALTEADARFREIERLYYAEGKDLSWRAAHMRAVAEEHFALRDQKEPKG